METLRKAVIVVAVATGVALMAGQENVSAQKASERVGPALAMELLATHVNVSRSSPWGQLAVSERARSGVSAGRACGMGRPRLSQHSK